MEQRPLGATGIQVPVYCLGTMTFGTPVAEPEAVGLIDRALDLGLCFIDTANSYEGYTRRPGTPGGVAEAIVGRALRGRWGRALVATKVGMKIGPDADDEGLGPAHLRRECERSLRRLGADAIGLYYLHRPDPVTPVAETVAAMADLITRGWVRYWGVSNHTPAQLGAVLEACYQGGWPRPVACQPAWSPLRPEAETELIPMCRREGLAVVAYRVLEGGLLSGKYQAGKAPPAGSRGASQPDWVPFLDDPAMRSRWDGAAAAAACAGLDLYTWTLRAGLAVDGMTSLILGATRPAQLEQAVAALARP